MMEMLHKTLKYIEYSVITNIGIETPEPVIDKSLLNRWIFSELQRQNTQTGAMKYKNYTD